ncbi:MAG: hypothetical protein KatS3mg094_111 [Candidatus Parcubacteria bacterium]|nr:MAG: hypothetical protein KatS3mg094_111 [Candidatus Parcubacteria bacterium]
MREQLRFNFYDNSDELEGWDQITPFEKVKRQPKYIGYDYNNNFIVDFEVINRHNVVIVKRFIFNNEGRVSTKIISSESPVGVNISNDFKAYTEISNKCFKDMLNRALAIYKDYQRRLRAENQQNNEDQLSLDI